MAEILPDGAGAYPAYGWGAAETPLPDALTLIRPTGAEPLKHHRRMALALIRPTGGEPLKPHCRMAAAPYPAYG